MEYQYSVGILRRIARSYHEIYTVIGASKPSHYRIRPEVELYALCKVIAGEQATYREIAELLKRSDDITNQFSVVEYKADFDRALNAIGRGKWDGMFPAKPREKPEEYPRYFKQYRNFGQLQRVVIAIMLHIGDDKLRALGIKGAWSYRASAFKAMANYLNDEKIW